MQKFASVSSQQSPRLTRALLQRICLLTCQQTIHRMSRLQHPPTCQLLARRHTLQRHLHHCRHLCPQALRRLCRRPPILQRLQRSVQRRIRPPRRLYLPRQAHHLCLRHQIRLGHPQELRHLSRPRFRLTHQRHCRRRNPLPHRPEHLLRRPHLCLRHQIRL